MRVTKMHALGNNYVYVNLFELVDPIADWANLAIRVSDVRRGIGSDGLILMGPARTGAVSMRIFNADGSEAETCGNGLRCVAKYVYERRMVADRTFLIETKAGIVEATVHPQEEGRVARVTVDMGVPTFGASAVHYAGTGAELNEATSQATIHLADGDFTGTLVSMGNPHFVVRVADAAEAPVSTVGPLLERHPAFSQRVNVEFVSVVRRDELLFRVWERGSGITFACGTGACASVAAGVAEGWLDPNVRVHLLGGDLDIAIVDGRVYMTGEAVEVFEGEFHDDGTWLTHHP